MTTSLASSSNPRMLSGSQPPSGGDLSLGFSIRHPKQFECRIVLPKIPFLDHTSTVEQDWRNSLERGKLSAGNVLSGACFTSQSAFSYFHRVTLLSYPRPWILDFI